MAPCRKRVFCYNTSRLMIPLKERLREDLFARLGDRYPLKPADIEFGYPPRPEFGDLSVTFPFKLAKELKVNPRLLAAEMLEHLTGIGGITRAEIAGPGYINFFLDRGLFFRDALTALTPSRPSTGSRASSGHPKSRACCRRSLESKQDNPRGSGRRSEPRGVIHRIFLA